MSAVQWSLTFYYLTIWKTCIFAYDIRYMDPASIALIIILIISVVIHEVAHGYAANWLGDPTARLQGRLSANPLVHLDPLMSVIIPGLLIMSGSPLLFGAAKPVPYNPYNLTNQKWGEAIVAAAGPIANIILALIFAMIVRNAEVLSLSVAFVDLSVKVIMLNLFLAFFNLIPIPPLDGSKILPKFLPASLAMKYHELRYQMERNTFASFLIIILAYLLIFSEPLFKAVLYSAYFLAGLG